MTSSTMPHFGLFFTADHVERARRQRDRAPFAACFDLLAAHQPTGVEAAQWHGLRYRFNEDADAGAAALAEIDRAVYARGDAIEDRPFLDTVAEAVMLVHAFEMVRDHPAADFTRRTTVLNHLQGRVGALSTSPFKDSYVENLWVALFALCAGIALEDSELVAIGADVYRDSIDQEIRPQGYITKAVEGGDGGAMFRQVMSAAALVLMAEAASHVGIDLWGYEHRGISAVTAAIYPMYYFYTTEKWEWDKELSPEEVQAIFRRVGGYLEIVRAHTPLKDINPLLEDLRPMLTPFVVGLPTLTHGVSIQRKRGLFGFGYAD